jgi:hypothetical protein
MGDIMKRLWNMSQTTKVILCSIFVLVLVIEPNLSLAAPWFTSQKAYGETAVAAQEAAATEGQAATPEATVAEEPVAAEEPAVEEQEPVAVEEGPSAEAPAAEEPATEEQTADEAVEPTPAESPVAVEATSPVTTPTAEVASTTSATSAPSSSTSTPAQDTLVPMAATDVAVSYDGGSVSVDSGTFSFGTSGVSMGVLIEGTRYDGTSSTLSLTDGESVTLELSFPEGQDKSATVTLGQGNSKTILSGDADKNFSFTMSSDITQIAISIQDLSSAELSYENNKVVPSAGTFTFGSTGVTAKATVGGVDYTGDSGDIIGVIGSQVVLTFDGIPSDKVVTVEKDGSKTTIDPTASDKTFTFALGTSSTQVNISVDDVTTTSIMYQSEKLTPTDGSFAFTPTGIACTVKVGGTGYQGSSADIPAPIGSTVEITFTGIPAGGKADVSVGGQQRQVTSANPTVSFTMDQSTNQIQVDLPSTTIVWSGGTPTVQGGTFTFGTIGLTMTAKVGGSSYTGSSVQIPALSGETVALDFDVPTGKSVLVEVQTAGGPQSKTLTSSDHAFSFTMDENSGTVTVGTSTTLSLSSTYDATYQSTYASIQYRVNGGVWTDLATNTTAGTGQSQQGTTYTYTLPSGTADVRIIQPTDGTGKLTTNGGKGWMGSFQSPSGTGVLQPYPSEFNANTGYEIDGYGSGTFFIAFTTPYGSLFWYTDPTHGPYENAALKNGTVLIHDLTDAAIFDQTLSYQTADGTEGFAAVIDPTATITATLTPARGYQVLSTNIKGANGEAVTLTPDADNACTFTFNVANNINMPIFAIFTKVADTASSTSATVSTVSLTNADAAIDSGNLDLKVADAGTTDTAAATAAGGGAAVVTYDVTLDQYWNQGSTTSTWTKNLTTIDTAATVTMQLDDSLKLTDGETYKVVRNHDGVETVVDSTYDAASNTLSFDSNQYSEFTLVKSGKTATATATMRYDGSDLAATNGTFTYGSSGVTATAEVAGMPFTGSTAGITADVGDEVTLTFSGIKDGMTVKVTVNGSEKTLTAADATCTFTMREDTTITVVTTTTSATTTASTSATTPSATTTAAASDTASTPTIAAVSTTSSTTSTPKTADPLTTTLLAGFATCGIVALGIGLARRGRTRRDEDGR